MRGGGQLLVEAAELVSNAADVCTLCNCASIFVDSPCLAALHSSSVILRRSPVRLSCCRSEERQLSIVEQGYKGVSYIPTLQQGPPADDLGKAACLNRALRRLYPNDDTPISGKVLEHRPWVPAPASCLQMLGRLHDLTALRHCVRVHSCHRSGYLACCGVHQIAN